VAVNAQEAAEYLEVHPPAMDPTMRAAAPAAAREDDGWKWHCLRAAALEQLPS